MIWLVAHLLLSHEDDQLSEIGYRKTQLIYDLKLMNSGNKLVDQYLQVVCAANLDLEQKTWCR